MRHARWLSGLMLVHALAGCNGSGNSEMSGPRAMDDQFSAATASVQVLDVLANDSDSHGALTIVSVMGSGQVVLEVQDGNRIRYQPACCSITTDQFTYTVRNSKGQMATATVHVAVQRRIALTLRAPSLSAIAQASLTIGTMPVSLTISGTTATATVDYRTDDQLLVATLAQSARLVLRSALGSVPELASRTPPSGQLNADLWPALEVSPFTTSLAGTLAVHTADSATAFDARLSALTDWEGVTRRANYLASVLAAGESALPPTGTLYDLAVNTNQIELLIENTTIASGPRGALFPASAQGPLATTGGTFWFYRGGTNVDEDAYKLELAPGGTGTLVGPLGAIGVNWSVAQNALSIVPAAPAGSAPVLLTTGLITRRGGACEFNVPKLFERVDRVSVTALRLAGFAYSAPAASVAPEAWIASVIGTKVSGFTQSGCQPIVVDADAGPSFPFEVRNGVPATVAALSLSAGRWLVPAPGAAGLGRPLPEAEADVSADGSGTGAGVLSFSSHAQADGSLVLDYADGSSARLYAVARYGDAFRVVVETHRASGERRVDEAWLARVVGVPGGFANALRDTRLRGCCRIAALRTLRFDAQGQASWELTSGGLAPAEVSFSAPRDTLTVQLAPIEGEALVIDPVAPLPDGRVLTFSRLEDEPTGGAEVITLEPLSP